MTAKDNDCRPAFEAWLASCGRNPLMWNTTDAMLAAWVGATSAQREALARVQTERRHDLKIQSAMAADQKAVAEALGIPPGEYSGGAGEQLLAIAKLREDLARVEAERDEWVTAFWKSEKQHDTAQANLAEAVGLLTKARRYVEQDHPDGIHSYQPNSISGDLLGDMDAFLARHAQAEQQEAQGAQAGDKQRECCNEECGWKGFTDRVLSGHGKVPDVGPLCPECGETTERAALATQPADSIAVNRLRLSLVAWDAELAEQDYQLTADDLRDKLREIHRDIDRLMPEQGQAAVRGAEQ